MISIIIPVYNVASYLNKCLHSVLDQSYSQWECIMVDDGSTDESGEICDAWAVKDHRFHVVHQANAGVSHARNVGVRLAKGDYVTFVDSDDWLDLDYLRDLIPAKECEIVVSGYRKINGNEAHAISVPSATLSFLLDVANIDCFVELNRKFLLYAPYAKLFFVSIIRENHIIFPEACSFGEDLQFNYRYLEHVRTIRQVAKANYNYRILGSNTLSTKKRPEQFHQDYGQWKILKSFYVSHNLWVTASKELLYERLWGIVYDGIFSTETPVKEILSIPEINELKEFNHVFTCSYWIKWCILHKISIFFRK